MQEGFSWLQENCDTYCVTFTQGLSATELLQRFGGNLLRAKLIQPDDWETLGELQPFGEVIQAGWCAGWAFVLEDIGYQGTLPEILQTVSAGTVAVSVSYSVNADTCFSSAQDGTLLTSFDTLAPPFEDASPQVLALFEQAGLSQEATYADDYDFVGAMFALAEASGVRLNQEAIAEKPLLCSFIRNPFSDFVEDLLAQGGNEQTLQRLLDLLNNHEHKERLFDFLNERHQTEYVRDVAERMLSALLAAEVIPPLLQELREEQAGLHTMHLQAVITELLLIFIRFDQAHDDAEAREHLLTLTSATEPWVALHAALALGELGDPRAIEPLLRLLPLYPERQEIIQLLGKLHASQATELFYSLLIPQSKNNDVHDSRILYQRDLIDALEQIEGQNIVERLLPLLHPEPETGADCSFQQGVLAAVARQGDAQVVEVLLKLLNPHPVPMYSYDFQLRLLEALATLGEKLAIEPLARLLAPDVSQLSTYEHIFQEYLIQTLRQLGDTRKELQAVEEALQSKVQTRKLVAKVTQHRRDPQNNHPFFPDEPLSHQPEEG